jgi:flagellar biosynthesis chaperone FliJ
VDKTTLKLKRMASKKEKVIEELYKICKKKNDYVFHNDIVKDVCKRIGFGNPFDVTKLYNKSKIP